MSKQSINPFFKENKKQRGFFITAGYPKFRSLGEQLFKLQNSGVDFIEVGMPFSDPVADGPTIQMSSEIALENGMTIPILFEQIEQIRGKIKVPLVLMGYLNPVWKYGMHKFLTKCAGLGINSVIIPDLSVEIYERDFQSLFEKTGVALIFLITPETSDERIRRVSQYARQSFMYLISRSGITGSQLKITSDLTQRYSEIREICGSIPIFIGFGITRKKHVQLVCEYADGAIIGSAYLKAIHEGKEDEFLKEIL